MSMKFFTLSAVCMLIFCMLLALSGTTDFPVKDPAFISESVPLSDPVGQTHPGKGEAMESVRPVPDGSAEKAETGVTPTRAVSRGRPGQFLLLGIVLITAWIFLSHRLFFQPRGESPAGEKNSSSAQDCFSSSVRPERSGDTPSSGWPGRCPRPGDTGPRFGRTESSVSARTPRPPSRTPG